MTPKEKPRDERMMREDIARSHFSFSRASLTGLPFGVGRGGSLTFSVDMVGCYAGSADYKGIRTWRQLTSRH